ncbi:alpha/beta hydrolase [Formosa sp. S-31]|uniref:alpha/beta hydrolase n=1 Tax=Formosa sp. S-31 TaxID=2790949 RepID=UPI003EC0A5E7
MKITTLLYKTPFVYLLCLSLGMITSVYSQNIKTIPLWETEIPNSISNSNYKEAPEYDNDILSSTSRVTTPTLTVYTPAPETANGTAVVVCPGGGYSHLAMNKEGLKVGSWLSQLGITVFVLKYRLPSDDIMTNKTIGPLQDAQEAVRYARRHAKNYHLNPDKIGVLGFSAGGHLASTLSTHYNDAVYQHDNISARPDFSILIYPVISMKDGITHQGSKTCLLGKNPAEDTVNFYSNELQITPDTPPTFLIHATDDGAVPVENSLNYYLALKANKVPAEMHIFEKGGHGFGLSKPEIHLYWQPACENWLRLQNLIPVN